MLAFILGLVLGALPLRQLVNDTERLCIKDSYFIINWKSSPLTICEDPGKSSYCYLMNPFDTAIRFGNPYIRVVDGNYFYDLGKCP